MANVATSIYFGGSSSYKIVIDGSTLGLNISTAHNNTFEMWICPDYNGSEASPMIWGMHSDNVQFAWSNSSKHHYWQGSAIDNGNTPNGTVPDDHWTHLAWVFNGRKMFVFADGLLVGYSTFSSDVSIESLKLGTNPGGSEGNWFRGYMDQIRWSKSSRYGNFDVPTTYNNTHQTAGRGRNAVLPHQTCLLVQSKFEADGSTTFEDQSIYACPITVTGDITHQGEPYGNDRKSPYHAIGANTSIRNDGSPNTNRLEIPASFDHPKLERSHSEMSVDFWYRYVGRVNSYDVVFEIPAYNASGVLFQWQTDNKVDIYHGSSPSLCMADVDMDIGGGWHHYCWAKRGNVATLHIDGALWGANTATTYNTFGWNGTGLISILGASHGANYAHSAYMDDFRICMGVQAYTANFVPYGGQKNVAPGRGGATVDSSHTSANTHELQMGQAINSTNANTYCLEFDGTNDYIFRGPRDGAALGTFSHHTNGFAHSDDRGTIFAWIYLDDSNDDGTIFAIGDEGSATKYVKFWIDGSSRIGMGVNNAGTADTVYAGTVSAAGWHSVAVTSSGTAYTFYIDGTSSSPITAGSGTNSGAWFSDVTTCDFISIGAHRAGGTVTNIMDGKIMGVAVWGDGTDNTGILSADQISALHSAGKGHDLMSATGLYTQTQIDALRGYWRMGNSNFDSAGRIYIYDATGNGNVLSPYAVNAKPVTWTTGTTFLEGWQDRGHFSGDKHTALLIQSAHANGSTTFTDTGPGFKKTSFDGTADYASAGKTSSGTTLAYRSSDTQGTFICWINTAAVSGDDRIFTVSDVDSADHQLSFFQSWGKFGIDFETSGNATRYHGVNNGPGDIGGTGSGSPGFGTWVCAAVRSDGTRWDVFIDGVKLVDGTEAQITVTGSGDGVNDGRWFSSVSSADNITVGNMYNSGGATDYFKGLIAQIGIWGGSSGTTGVLTDAQIAAIAALDVGADWTTSYSTGLVDYWTFGNKSTEGTDSGSTIYSQVSGGQDLAGTSLAAPYHALTVAASGDVHHDGTHSYFSGSAIKFDGTGDKLVVADGGSLDLVYGTGDFCVEFWVMHEGASWGNEGIFCNEDGTDNDTETLRITSVGSGTVSYIQYRLVDQGAATNEINLWSDSTASYDALLERCWYHVACVRVNGQAQLWQDGVLKDWATSAHNHTNLATEGIKIGLQRGSDYFSGWLDEIRMSIGTSRYTKSIERLANTFVTKGDTGDAYTVLQVQSRGVRNGTTYNDDLNRTGTSTTTASVGGNPVWITSGGDPLGGSNTALYFNGVDDYIDFKDSSDFEPGTGQFTVEYWMKPNIADEFKTIWTKGGTGYSVDYGGFQNAIHASPARMAFQHKIPTTGSGTLGGDNHIHSIQHKYSGVAVNKWSHHIIQRSVDTHSYFIDGVLMSSNSSSQALTDNLTAGSYPLRMGISHDSSAASHFKGYIADFRFSKGIARYGGISLANTTTRQITSSNSDTQVVTSNSTFGTGEATIPFTSDEYTSLLINGTEVYGSGATFPATKSTSLGANSSAVLTITKGDGTSGTHATVPSQMQGISAFGANSYYLAGPATSAGDYFTFAHDTSFDMSDTDSFTLEAWYYCPSGVSVSESPNFRREIINLSPVTSGTDSGRNGMIGLGFNHWGSGNFPLQMRVWSGAETQLVSLDSDPYFYLNNHKGEWHHYVGQKRNAVYEIFIDGKLMNTKEVSTAIATKASVPGSIGYARKGGVDYFLEGYIDSVRISKGIARYGYSGTNAKVGKLAVHPSHCKLLITSNTHNKNTHFDDFSDQGNYWNQTPKSYYFDGSDQRIDCGDPNWSSNLSDGFTVCAWLKPSPIGYHYIVSQREDASNREWGFYTSSEGYVRGRVFSSASSFMTFNGQSITTLTEDAWNLIAMTFDGTNSTSCVKLYGNGNDVSATGSDSGSFDGTIASTNANLIIGFRDEGDDTDFTGGIAQVVMWDDVKTLANIKTMWEAGPTADMTTSFSSNMLGYWAMGNHNGLAGRPADTAAKCYDRSGNGVDGTPTGSTWYAPHKGNLIIPAGNVKHSTDVKNFGSSSIYFDSNDDILKIPNDGQFTTSADFTVEFWMNTTDSGASCMFDFRNGTNGNNLYFDHINTTSVQFIIGTNTRVFTPGSPASVSDGAWHHVVIQRNSGKSYQFFWDGKELGQSSGTGTMYGDLSTAIATNGVPLFIGENYPGTAGYEGYLDEFGFYRVAKYAPVAFPDKVTQTPSYHPDPTGNHFTSSGLLVQDQLVDTPENNFCTLNPVSTGATYAEGNLKVTSTVAGSAPYKQSVMCTIQPSVGKWYWEVKQLSTGGVEVLGFSQNDPTNANRHNHYGTTGNFGWLDSGNVHTGGGTTMTAIWDGWTTGDILAFALDLDNQKVIGYKNGAPQEELDFSNGLTLGKHTSPTFVNDHTSSNWSAHFNFGQGDPEGENNYTDSNGIGGFRYPPPDDYLAICTKNMEDVDYASIGPNSVKGTPDKHFDTLLWRGDGNSPRQISGLNFQPDLVWMKSRTSGTNHHALFDSVRGINKRLISNLTGAEDTQSMCQSFDPGGMTIGDDRNNASENFVAWCWKAGNKTVENSDGIISSTISLNQDAGFSIVSYTGNGIANSTVGHGLGVKPDVVIIRNRSNGSQYWSVIHSGVGGLSTSDTNMLYLNHTQAMADDTNVYGDNIPTATTFGVDDYRGTNYSNEEFIAYCWRSVEGFSKFGKYEGNNSTDGQFVYLGFKPALLICKNVDATGNWEMYTSKIDVFNPATKSMFADTTGAEYSSGRLLDLLSNGFKQRNNNSNTNSNHTFVYMAWAEMPFKYATAR